MRRNKQYEMLAETIKDQFATNAGAFHDGTVGRAVADAATAQLAERLGKRLSAAHRGDYPFRMSRWDDATGLTEYRQDLEPVRIPSVRILNDNEPDRL